MLSSSNKLTPEYGALEEARPESIARRSTSKRAWVVVASIFAVACVGTLVFTAHNASSAVTNANRNRQEHAPTQGVAEKTTEVLDLNNGIRWAIFGFNKARDAIVPLVQGPATNNWKKDFNMFVNALPEKDIAAAVYNFEYWTGDDTYALDPLLITWAPGDVDIRTKFKAGYFLGAVIVATDHPDDEQQLDMVALQRISESYEQFCENERGLDPQFCMGTFHNCPFAESGAPQESLDSSNPCAQDVCDGALFVDSESTAGEAPEAIPGACCDYIKDYCAHETNSVAGQEVMGCHPVAMENVMALCDNKQVDPIPDCLLPPEECEGRQCRDECYNPCALMDGDDSQTYLNCSGCGEAYQCRPGQPGFQAMRCCGADAECGVAGAQNQMACEALEAFGCAFVKHAKCPAYEASQLSEEETGGEEDEDEASVEEERRLVEEYRETGCNPPPGESTVNTHAHPCEHTEGRAGP